MGERRFTSFFLSDDWIVADILSEHLFDSVPLQKCGYEFLI